MRENEKKKNNDEEKSIAQVLPSVFLAFFCFIDFLRKSADPHTAICNSAFTQFMIEEGFS